jgi:4-amino-4-deoxy-L-arabinose transferase-like glycosyltransferase
VQQGKEPAMSDTAMTTGKTPEGCALRLALIVVGAATLLRIAALFLSPLQLYPDEAQYWLWSRHLAWGYASKPPLIAWLIRLTTAAGGDAEAWIRLSAPFLHAGAALALYAAGRRLYTPAVGLLACVLWTLMPAVQVSALFIATDAPLMVCLCLALWAYAAMLTGGGRKAAIGLGGALGLAFLAKYAALFFLGSLLLHALLDRKARRSWGRWKWALVLIAFSVLAAPNLAWNATHHFAAATHVAEVNVQVGPHVQRFNPGKFLEFVLGQFGVMGPIPYGVLIAGVALAIRRRKLDPRERMLLCFLAPPVLIVTAESFLSRAHAHWAAAGYTAGTVLAAAWLVRWRARGWTVAAIAVQGVAALVFVVVMAWPQIGDKAGFARRFNRIRGWDQVAAGVGRVVKAEAGLTAVVVDDRYMFNEIAYYGRGWLAEPGAPPLRMRPPAGPALNEAELSAPLQTFEGAHVLIAEDLSKPQKLTGDFAHVAPRGGIHVPLDGKHPREVGLYLGAGFKAPSGHGSPQGGATSR